MCYLQDELQTASAAPTVHVIWVMFKQQLYFKYLVENGQGFLAFDHIYGYQSELKPL